MNKLFILLFTTSLLVSSELPTQKATLRHFSDTTTVNAKVVQLSHTQQMIMPRMGGTIEKYYVKSGEQVKANQKIAKINSIALAKMTADFLAVKEQFQAIKKNHQANKVLYEKGVISLHELNNQSIAKDDLLAKKNQLTSQLATLGINTKRLTNVSSTYILYAHSKGKVNQILQPLHAVVSEQTPIMSIVKENAYYLKAFIPLRFANKLTIGLQGKIEHHGEFINAHLTQVLPEVDQQTQRIITFFALKTSKQKLFINAYLPLTVFFASDHEYVAIRKSALSFFDNEWVIYLPHDHEQEHHDEDEKMHQGSTDVEEEHDHHVHKEDNHLEPHLEEKHDDHEEEKVPYDVRVITIVADDGEYVGVKGLHEGETYVSDQSYFVKSMLLKSSLGGHGH